MRGVGSSGSRRRPDRDPCRTNVDVRSVLCVDDHDFFLSGLRRVFEADGWHVTTSTTARGARQAAHAGTFHFMVIDFRLPDQSGVDLIRELFASGIGTPTLIITGHPDAPSAIAASRLDVDYVVKSESSATQVVALARERSQHRNPSDPLKRLLGATAGVMGVGAKRADVHAFAQVFAQVLANRHTTFVEFMTVAEARRGLLRRETLRLPIAQQLQFLGDRIAARRTIAQSSGLEGAFQQGASAIRGALQAKSVHVAGLGWSPRLSGLAIAMRCGAVELASTSEHVAQIAYVLGYNHHTAFDRHFRDFIGCSPTEFRRLLQENAASA